MERGEKEMHKLGDENSETKALQKLIWDLWEI